MTHRLKTATALAALLLSLTGCVAHQPHGPRHTELQEETVVLPTRLSRGLWLLLAELPNVAGRHWMLLDTGTDRMLLDLHMAQRIGLRSRAAETVQTATGGAIPSHRLTPLPWLRAGGARFLDVDVAGVDLSQLRSAGGLPIVGIVGCDLFRQTLLEMDYQQRRARVLPRAMAPTTPAIHYEERLPHVTVDAAGTSVRALVDTGFQHSLAVPPEQSLRWLSIPRQDGELATLDGVIAKSTVRLAGDLTLDGIRLQRPRIILAPGRAKVGAALLRRGRLVLDAGGGRVWLGSDRGE
jgi:predicted aspartyl protease